MTIEAFLNPTPEVPPFPRMNSTPLISRAWQTVSTLFAWRSATAALSAAIASGRNFKLEQEEHNARKDTEGAGTARSHSR
ncbi:hypothetical protein [Mesorhizobium silamurunense]|uniref:hypothetical protein n=1 Tax=Mesorhizobium silamurunense TaxID=499528 RepID=UPI001786E2CA|nr:hypothetical protein [Mesorhizobium silamurunense]